jgi:hypothetical protein
MVGRRKVGEPLLLVLSLTETKKSFQKHCGRALFQCEIFDASLTAKSTGSTNYCLGIVGLRCIHSSDSARHLDGPPSKGI